MLADGIVGLGPSNPDGYITLIQNLYDKKSIQKRIFSVFLNNNQYENDDTRKPKSMLTIGGIDLDTYSDGTDPTYYNVVPEKGLWALKLNSVDCKDTKIDDNSDYAVLDTMHTKIVGPKSAIKKLFDRFEAMYGCGYHYSKMVCDCSEIYSIVKFHITENFI